MIKGFFPSLDEARGSGHPLPKGEAAEVYQSLLVKLRETLKESITFSIIVQENLEPQMDRLSADRLHDWIALLPAMNVLQIHWNRASDVLKKCNEEKTDDPVETPAIKMIREARARLAAQDEERRRERLSRR
jgi:hypothetical protein